MKHLLVQNNNSNDGKVAAWFNLPVAAQDLWVDYELVIEGSSPAIPADMNWQGDWNAATNYAEDDAVLHNGHVWQALFPMPAGVEPGNPVRPPDSVVQANLHGLDVMASDRLAASSWVYKKIRTSSIASDDTGHRAAASMVDMNVETAFQVNIANDHPTSALEVKVYDENSTTKASYTIAAGATSGDLALGTTTPATPSYFDRFILCSFADGSTGGYRIKIKPNTLMRNLANPPSLNTFIANIHSVRSWTYNRLKTGTPLSIHISNEDDLTDLSGRPAVPIVIDRTTTSTHVGTIKNNHPTQTLNVTFYNVSLGALGSVSPNPIPVGATATFTTDNTSGDIFAIAYFGSGADALVPGDFEASLTNSTSLNAPVTRVYENMEWDDLGDRVFGTEAPHIFEFYRDNFNIDNIPANRLIGMTALAADEGGFRWKFDLANASENSDFLVGIGVTYLVRAHLVHTGGLLLDSWSGETIVNGVQVHNIKSDLPKPADHIRSVVLRPVGGAHDTKLLINWIKMGSTAGGSEYFKSDYDEGDVFP